MSDGTGIDSSGNVREYVDATYGDANSCMSAPDRAEAVMRAVNERLATEGVPNVGYQFYSGDANSAGYFDFRTWQMFLNEIVFDPAHYDQSRDADQADLIDTVYHEGRHSEQWFRAARERAGLSATAAQIQQVMGIPSAVADAAVANPILQCDASQYEAEEWYRSVYGDGSAHREAVLGDVDNHYAEYRALPEEADAWRTGGDVTNEYMSRQVSSMPADAPRSDDGNWWWDGTTWQPVQ